MSTREKLDKLWEQEREEQDRAGDRFGAHTDNSQFVKEREEQEQERARDRSMAYIHNSQQVLTELLNLPQSSGPRGKDYAQANADFDKRYKTHLRNWRAAVLSGVFLDAVETYREDRGRGEQKINSLVGVIFNERLPGPRGRPTAAHLNIVGGKKIEIDPRDLLDVVALKFLEVHKSISRCKREGCNRLFIRDYPNERHCSPPCKEEARAISQRDSMRKRRAKDAQQKKSAAKSKSRRKQ